MDPLELPWLTAHWRRVNDSAVNSGDPSLHTARHFRLRVADWTGSPTFRFGEKYAAAMSAYYAGEWRLAVELVFEIPLTPGNAAHVIERLEYAMQTWDLKSIVNGLRMRDVQ